MLTLRALPGNSIRLTFRIANIALQSFCMPLVLLPSIHFDYLSLLLPSCLLCIPYKPQRAQRYRMTRPSPRDEVFLQILCDPRSLRIQPTCITAVDLWPCLTMGETL